MLGTCLLLPALVLAACGDDDDRELSASARGEAVSEETSVDGPAGEVDGPASDEGSGSDTSNVCDVIAADEVATAASVEIVSSSPARIDAGYQEIDWWGVGCRYEAADGGDLVIARMLDDAREPLSTSVLDDLRAESESRTMFDEATPHQEVADLGQAAIFLASIMGSSDDLVIDTGSLLLAVGTGRGIDVDRDELQVIGALALERLG